jgi:hypothetical protein
VWGLVALVLGVLAYAVATSRGGGEASLTYEPQERAAEPGLGGPGDPEGEPVGDAREAEEEAAPADNAPADDAPPLREEPEPEPRDQLAEDRPPAAQPPPPEPAEEDEAEAPPTQNARISAEEARDVVDAYLRAGASAGSGTPEQMYSDRVRYYGRGVVSRAAVMQDKQYFLRRWPQRSYERASDVTVQESADGATVRFDYTFEVEGAGRGMRGEGWTELTFRREGDELRIVGENGGVRRRRGF